MVALVGTLAYEFQVALPLLARVQPAQRHHELDWAAYQRAHESQA